MSAPLRLNEDNLLDYLGKIAPQAIGTGPVVEPAGDGNINWVRRVRGAERSCVVKQARPQLERFPEYEAPTERIAIEARFYALAASFDPDRVCPRVLAFDPTHHVLVLEDLGDAERLDAALARGADVSGSCAVVAGFLGRLHAACADPARNAGFENAAMRRLHGEHIFHLPYRENDFPLRPAVAARAHELRSDTELIATIDAAYRRYLEPRGTLVHGDVQPGNVLLTPAGPKLLDAEIAHVGDPAFDIGQLLGHLVLPAAARGTPESARPALRATWQAYAATGPDASASTLARAARYAGIELLRRTLGAARHPAVEADAAALAVLDSGLELVRGGFVSGGL
ncbi:MAG: phosphotransferase [Myxococcota bacterium]|nr:phosphotransferase [Myxococcota bacterium]